MGIGWDEFDLVADAPTDASVTSEVYDRDRFENGWLDILHEAHADDDFVGTIRIVGGGFPSAVAAFDDIPISAAEYTVNGVAGTNVSITGLTLPTTSAPSTFTIANTLATTLRIRVPMVNIPRYVGVILTRTSGGSATRRFKSRIQAVE